MGIFFAGVVFIVWGGFWLWQNRYQYFFQGGGVEEVKQIKWNDKDGEVNKNKGEESEDGDYFKPAIQRYDCQNECQKRKNEGYEYCLEVCGLNEMRTILPQDDREKNCSEFESEFEQDVCWKRKAVSEKREDLCDEISDEKLRDVCHNRVVEELLP